jgi:hypothetical protein
MADRRPLAIALIVFVAAAVMFVGAILVSQSGSGVAGVTGGGSGTRGSGTRGHGSDRTNALEKGPITAESRYPKSIVLLPASNDETASGKVICGNCSFKTGEACNVMLWDKEANHLVTVLQNDKYDELDKLIGST